MYVAGLLSIAKVLLTHVDLVVVLLDLSASTAQLSDPRHQSTTNKRNVDSRYSNAAQSTSGELNRLMALIDETPNNDSTARWQGINETLLEPQELQVALNHALDLYFQWLAEDLRSLYRLLRGNARPSQEVHNTFEPGRRRSERINAVIAELVRVRSARRWEATLAEWHAR